MIAWVEISKRHLRSYSINWPVEGYESSHRKQKEVPLWEKYALSVDESAEYFGIGQNRLRSIIASNPDAEYLVTVGSKTMIKRKLFEKYLDIATAI